MTTQHIDVFNGDADGLCALQQLRLHQPLASERITGVKRDIRLLSRIQERTGCSITVLDISLDVNRAPLLQLLEQQNTIRYFDHHFAGALPDHPHFTSFIDPDPEVCTSTLVDRHLGGAYRLWALAGAFGDNQHRTAQELAATLNLSEADLALLRETGELLNYNGYGETLQDLHYAPEDLFNQLHPFENPLDFARLSEALPALREHFQQDQRQAQAVAPAAETEAFRFFRFPNEAWGRRIAGVFSNEQIREAPDQGLVVLVENGRGGGLVSVRAPLSRPSGADVICRSLGGGGRSKAAGINDLPLEQVPELLETVARVFDPQVSQS